MTMKKTALVLQARLDSSRLPGKSILPLGMEGREGRRPLIFHVMEAFSYQPLNEILDKKILACPEDSVTAFAPLAEEAGFDIVPGQKEDVLARYCLAIKHFPCDYLMRATGDNPFLFMDAAHMLLLEEDAKTADYITYEGMPHGSGVELVSSSALLRAEREAVLTHDREHVCPYLYNNPHLFNVSLIPAPAKWNKPDIRLTVDTQTDYERANLLFERLSSCKDEEKYKGDTIISHYRELFTGKSHE